MSTLKKSVMLVLVSVMICVSGCAFETGKGHGSLVKLSGELSLFESSGQAKALAGKTATVVTAGHEFPDFAKWGATQSATATSAQEGLSNFSSPDEQEALQNNAQISNANIARILRAYDTQSSRADVRD